MGAEASNVEILRGAYAEWDELKAQSLDCWLNIVSDDFSMTSLADGAEAVQFTAPRKDKDGLRDYLQGLTDKWEMIFYRIDEYVAEGDRVVAIGHTAWRNKATRKEMSTPKVDIWRFKDGKVVSYQEYYDTAVLYAAATP